MAKINKTRNSLIKKLYFLKNASCAELSSSIGKSFAAVQKLINDMIGDGHLQEAGHAPSTGGRRAQMYALKPDSFFTVAVAMDQYVTTIAINDASNEMVFSKHMEMPLKVNAPMTRVLEQAIYEVIKSSEVPLEKIIGIGLGMPGFIDFRKGLNHSFFVSRGMAIAEHLSDATGIPVYLDNDSSLVALAELRFGAARVHRETMVVNICWGVGLGMILNGELFRGNKGFAGEFSHIPLFNNNKLCQCGKSGCLETEASLAVILQKVREGLSAGRVSSILSNFGKGSIESDWEQVVNAALFGDRFAIEVLSDVSYTIGRGIAILIHLLNPETIVLSGRGALAGKLWLAPIQQALNEHCIPQLSAATTISVSNLNEKALLYGCSALVVEQIDRDERIAERIELREKSRV
jgi:predicted NBD/HSP70 family sugar kinase